MSFVTYVMFLSCLILESACRLSYIVTFFNIISNLLTNKKMNYKSIYCSYSFIKIDPKIFSIRLSPWL